MYKIDKQQDVLMGSKTLNPAGNLIEVRKQTTQSLQEVSEVKQIQYYPSLPKSM